MKIIAKIHILTIVFFFAIASISFASEKQLLHSYTALNKLKKSLIADEEYDKAIEFLKEFVGNYPETVFAQMAAIEIGDIYFKYLRDNYKALEYYITAIKKTDNPDLKRTILDKVANVQKAITSMELDLLEIALDDFYLTHLSYPKTLKDLNHKDKNILTDSWGEEYYYRTTDIAFLPGLPNQSYILFSKGRDKTQGTLDDISPDTNIQEKVAQKKNARKNRYPFRVKNVFPSDGILKGVITSSLKFKKYITVKEGDIIDNNIILGIKPEGIIIYTPDREALLIPIGE